MRRVYIAGALNADAVGYIKNMHNMIHYANEVRKLGFAVFVPGIDFLMGLQIGNWEYKDYFENSQPFLEVCDILFVCPNSENSKGTQMEIETAKKLDIPVVYSLDKLVVPLSVIEQKVFTIISDHLGVPLEEIKESNSFVDDLDTDSLDSVELIMAFEEFFDIEIPDEEAEKLLTVGETIKYIQNKLKHV